MDMRNSKRRLIFRWTDRFSFDNRFDANFFEFEERAIDSLLTARIQSHTKYGHYCLLDLNVFDGKKWSHLLELVNGREPARPHFVWVPEIAMGQLWDDLTFVRRNSENWWRWSLDTLYWACLCRMRENDSADCGY